jgi:hypothetical protein
LRGTDSLFERFLDENSCTGALPVVLVVKVLEKFSIMFFGPTFKE